MVRYPEARSTGSSPGLTAACRALLPSGGTSNGALLTRRRVIDFVKLTPTRCCEL